MNSKSKAFKYKKRHLRQVFIRAAAAAIAVLLLLAGLPTPSAAAAAAPDNSFSGDANASAILKNLDYTDVKGSNTWAKDAIYESGALGIMKGMQNMNRRFGRTDVMSKQEAIAAAYKAAGREAEAQTLGETMNQARTTANKKTDPLEIWYDGYLQLAANDGLISAQDLTDALNTDQSSLAAASFKRSAPAQRQELAFWFAKTLNLAPVRGQQDIFNNYVDWRSIDPDKIPYVETVLQDGIMNGNGSGRFNPSQPVTREQAAQVVKNAEKYVLIALKYVKNTGIIENIARSGDYSNGVSVPGRDIDVRNVSGNLDRITVTSPGTAAATGKNEQGGSAAQPQKKELVVCKNGAVGDSSLLKAGDRIEYITSSADSTVKYVNVISNANDVRYVLAQVNSIDTKGLLINVYQLLSMNFPDINSIPSDVTLNGTGSSSTAFRYSKSAAVTVNGANASIADVTPGSPVLLTISSNNTVTAIGVIDLGINAQEKYIVRGIVEENNPQLGYITLYNEDGTGTSKGSDAQLSAVRTYNYVNQNKLDVSRNHKAAKVDDVQPGDTVYLKLDTGGNVTSMSAVDNYLVKYGKVVSKSPGELMVEYEDGSQQMLDAGSGVLVIEDGKVTSLDSIDDGDRVKLLLNVTNKSTDLKEVTVEGSEHFITNIYKGTISNIDKTSDKLSVLNPQIFYNGSWGRTDRKGFTSIPMAEDFRIYAGGKVMDPDDADRLLKSNEAYIAVEKDYGGQERAVVLSYRNTGDNEVLYTDGITGAVSGSGGFSLAREFRQVGYGAGSIIVKYGRLVSGSSIADDDQAYMALNRDGSGDLQAGVVKIDQPAAASGIYVYRGRISGINENQDFTVESYSRLSGTDWIYYNTPKTFRLTYNTRMLGDNGVLNVRDFTDVGQNSSVGSVVYAVADGTDAKLISTAPYGTVEAKGKVYDIAGATFGDEGTMLSEPNSLVLRASRIYDTSSYSWKDMGVMNLKILKNSIIIKDGKIIKPSDIKKGDSVSVIKKDSTAAGDAFIITVGQ